MRLIGLGAPDDVILMPLNEIEATQPQTDTKLTENTTQNTKKRFCFYCNKLGRFKAECRKKKRENGNILETITTNLTPVQAIRSNATLAANPTKQKIAGMEQMLPTIHDPNVITNENKKRTTPSNLRQPKLLKNRKIIYAAPALRGNRRREGVFNRTSPIVYNNNLTTNFIGTQPRTD